MASGYKLYCHDEFNDMSVYPSETGDFTNIMGVITHLPTPPFTPDNYSFDGWYSDPNYTDEVLVGEPFLTSTENKEIVVHIYAKWVEEIERTVYSSMTALANEIRELSGTTGAIGLNDMISHVGDANNEVDVQSALIDQLNELLEGKTIGGSGGGPIVNTCTIEIDGDDSASCKLYVTKIHEGNIASVIYTPTSYFPTNYVITDCICHSVILLTFNRTHNLELLTEGVSVIKKLNTASEGYYMYFLPYTADTVVKFRLTEISDD